MYVNVDFSYEILKPQKKFRAKKTEGLQPSVLKRKDKK